MRNGRLVDIFGAPPRRMRRRSVGPLQVLDQHVRMRSFEHDPEAPDENRVREPVEHLGLLAEVAQGRLGLRLVGPQELGHHQGVEMRVPDEVDLVAASAAQRAQGGTAGRDRRSPPRTPSSPCPRPGSLRRDRVELRPEDRLCGGLAQQHVLGLPEAGVGVEQLVDDLPRALKQLDVLRQPRDAELGQPVLARAEQLRRRRGSRDPPPPA